MTPRKAVILGATGLIGNELIQQLANNENYQSIVVVGRTAPLLQHSKITFTQVDMNEKYDASTLDADDIYCCLGTTMKTAGSKEAFRKVDYEMVAHAVKAGQMYAKQFLVVSSLGANAQSGNFYLKVKGEMEMTVLSSTFATIQIFRPSILFGDRKEKQTGEKIGIVMMKFFGPLLLGPLKKYKGIQASTVATAMIKMALAGKKGKYIYESADIERIGSGHSQKNTPLVPSI